MRPASRDTRCSSTVSEVGRPEEDSGQATRPSLTRRRIRGARLAELLGLGAILAGMTLMGVPRSLADDDDDDQEIHQTVARISYISGNTSFSRGDDPDDWQAADLNSPMTLGDRVYTGDEGRLELQIHGGNYIRLGSQTDLTALNLTDDTTQFSLNEGRASFQIRRLGDDDVIEIDTPNAAVTFERTGEYRLDVDPEGNTRVGVRSGKATVAAAGGEVSLKAGEEMDIDGIESPDYDIVSLAQPDRFDGWVVDRERRLERRRSHGYVSADVVGAEDLDEYGRWVAVPGYGTVWTPTTVEADWRPYLAGHWVWQDPWGWTWVATEPWGWAPYHYGRWVVYRSRWYWVPVAPSAPRVVYSPALVAFVGGGPGWSASVTIGEGGWVGWFPLAPADPFVPWWGPPRQVNVIRTTNVTYVNRTYVTVINQNTFVSGGSVRTNVVRDRTVIRRVSAAPVARGPIPVTPTRASLRVAVRTDASQAPVRPARIAPRPVVARIAPPPAPPAFEKKLKVIVEGRGAPVRPAVAARIAAEDRGTARTRVAIRPAADPEGAVKLNPRRQDQNGARPEPVKPARGRPMAAPERPLQVPPAAAEAPTALPAPASPRDVPVTRRPRERGEREPVTRRPRERGEREPAQHPATPGQAPPAQPPLTEKPGPEPPPSEKPDHVPPPPENPRPAPHRPPTPGEPPPIVRKPAGEPDRPQQLEKKAQEGRAQKKAEAREQAKEKKKQKAEEKKKQTDEQGDATKR